MKRNLSTKDGRAFWANVNRAKEQIKQLPLWMQDVMKNRKPSEVWGMGVNKYGIWGGQPIKFFWNKEFDEYLDENQDRGVFGLGLVEKAECTTFASETRKDVVAFIKKTKEELNE
jgi:hypothetical protein